MTSSSFPDPFQLWRDAVTRMENEINSRAADGAKSQALAQSLQQLSNASQTIQQLVERALEGYLRRVNLPSRKQVAELADSLRRIEDKLDRLAPAQAPVADAPRPARTRKPSAAAVPEPAPEAAPAPAQKPVSRGKRPGKR
jgi:hypothetical protein